MFAWGDAELVVGRGAESRRARGLWVSGDYFGVLGIAPARGRLLAPDDDRNGCAAAAVISHGFWQSSFGGRENAVGSALTVLDRPVTVIGVAPASFTGLEVGETFDIALPLCATALWDGRMRQLDRWWLTIMGRLKPEWTIARANEHLRALSPGVLDATVPPDYDPSLAAGYRGLRFGVVPAGRGVSRLRDAHAASLTLLFGLTGLVLLMTCGNLATLMLARASAREREVALRAAIGASRGRLVSQMLIESLLVAAAGAVLALPVALVSARALIALLGTSAGPHRASTLRQLAADGVRRRHRDADCRPLRTAARAARLARRPQHGHAPRRARHHGRSPSRTTPARARRRADRAVTRARLLGAALRADVPEPRGRANGLRSRRHARDFVHGSCVGRAPRRTKSRVPGAADA